MTHTAIAALVVAALASVGGGQERRAPQAPDAAGAPPSPVAISSMGVDLWPEYDDPRVLVIYRGSLATSVETPTPFTFLVPEGAQIHMAGAVDENGGHIHGLFRTRSRDDGLVEVSYELTVPDFYMEFYYDPFTGGPERSFTYPVVSPYDVATLTVSVQQPLRAEAFSVSPFTQEVVRYDDGFDYHVLRRENVPAGTREPVSVAYRKVDGQPSVAPQEAGGAAAASERRTMRNILAFVSVLLVGVVAYALFIGSRRGDAEDDPTGPRRPARAAPPGAASRFCTQCGEALAPTDRHCGACGHPTPAPGGHAGRSQVIPVPNPESQQRGDVTP